MSEFYIILGLLIAAATLFATVKYGRRSATPDPRAAELRRIQYEKERADLLDRLKADVSARLVKIGKSNYRLKIYNRGKAEARNVRVDFPEDHIFVQQSIIQKLPMSVLKPGEGVEIVAAPHLGSRGKFPLHIIWSDDSAADRSQTIEVTL